MIEMLNVRTYKSTEKRYNDRSFIIYFYQQRSYRSNSWSKGYFQLKSKQYHHHFCIDQQQIVTSKLATTPNSDKTPSRLWILNLIHLDIKNKHIIIWLPYNAVLEMAPKDSIIHVTNFWCWSLTADALMHDQHNNKSWNCPKFP